MATIVELIRDKKVWEDFKATYSNYIQYIVELINDSYAAGYSQPFEVVATLGNCEWYHNPNFVIYLHEHALLPQMKNFTEYTFYIPNAIMNYAKALNQISKFDESKTQAKTSLELYKKIIDSNREIKDIDLIKAADCSNINKDFKYSLELLNKIKYKNQHFYHRQAQALDGLGKKSKALKSIDEAIKLSQNDKFLSAFIDCKANILKTDGKHKEAIDTWEEAILNADGEQFKNDIHKKIEETKKLL